MTPQKQALAFLTGLEKDIRESESGYLSIEKTDKKQVINCINVIGKLMAQLDSVDQKQVTRKKLVEINKEWIEDCIAEGWLEKSLSEVHEGWQDPAYPEICADYVWEKLGN